MVTIVPTAPASTPKACPICGEALRPIVVDGASTEGSFCPKDGFAVYSPRALEAARRRLAELHAAKIVALDGVDYLLKADTNCAIDGRRDVCAEHRFLSRDHWTAGVMAREFGGTILARLKSASEPALGGRGASRVGPSDPRRRL